MTQDKGLLFWKERIKQYIDSDWSNRPSPFALEVATYLAEKSKILELGCGAGQDGVWFASQGHNVVISDYTDTVFNEIDTRLASNKNSDHSKTQLIDVTKTLPFDDSSLDCVYAQLSLHYFTDRVTRAVFNEINRVLRRGGVIAVMMNTIDDEEYNPALLDSEGFIYFKDIKKRYFSVDTLSPFTKNFNILLLDNLGRTPKDDEKHNSGMIRFVGRKT